MQTMPFIFSLTPVLLMFSFLPLSNLKRRRKTTNPRHYHCSHHLRSVVYSSSLHHFRSFHSQAMSVSGVTCSPWKCCPARRSAWKLESKFKFLPLQRSYWRSSMSCRNKRVCLVKCTVDASYGGEFTNHHSDVFPRIHVRDPYKRLGIPREASEDEIQAARNFLIHKYSAHKPSVDAIESAHDKIIMQKFYERKNPKIDIKKKVREVKQSHVVQAVTSRFQSPPTMVIARTSVAFLALAALTVLFPTEEGPTLQVAISLGATIYFIYDRLKSKLRAFLYGVGAFIFSWLLGTFLMVSVVPPLPFIKGLRSFEVTTSLITYVLLWVSSTYLK